MARTEQYKRRVPVEVQGVVIDGIRLTGAVYVPLKDGMTRAKAVAFTEDLIARARQRVNYKLTDADAWEIATAVCDAAEGATEDEKADWMLWDDCKPTTSYWLQKVNRRFSLEDEAKVFQWVERI